MNNLVMSDKTFFYRLLNMTLFIGLLWFIEPGFRSCDPRKARGAILAQQSRWVCASDPMVISGAAKGRLSFIAMT